MKITIGNKWMGEEEKDLDTNEIRFVAEDNRTLFSVRILNETTIEIAGVNVCKIGGKLFQETLSVQPRAANQIWVSATEYKNDRIKP